MSSRSKENQYKARFLLLGFNSEVNQILLDGGIIIRKGSDSELEEIRKRIATSNVDNQEFFLEYEFTSSDSNTFEAYTKMNEFNIFFEIFYNGIIKTKHFIRFIMIDNLYQSAGLCSDSKVSGYFPNEYHLLSEQIEQMKINWFNYRKVEHSENKALKIAMNRFLFSTQKYDSEDCLIDLMIAFEAVYLDASEKGELSYKLALRCANFLRFQFDCLDLFEFMKKAYNLRSSIVHGANIKGNDIKFKGKSLDLKSVNMTLTIIIRETFKRIILEMNELKITQIIQSIDMDIVKGSVKGMD